jgi:SnoaL-like domain
MDELTRLAAIEDIKQLKHRYFRCVDMKDWDLIDSVFHDDFVGDFRGSATDPVTGFNAAPDATSEVIHGREATVASFRAAGATFTSVHHGHNPEITVTSPTSAHGIWALFDTLRFPAGDMAEFQAYGHYHETYEKVDGAWKIKTSRLTRLRVDTFMR